jgi:serine/threonine protein kinase
MPPNPQPQAPSLSPGTVLRRQFVVDDVLADTHMSTVYGGWELGCRPQERRIVIKRLSTAPKPGGLTRRAAVRAFRQEATVLRSLNHPQIPRLRAAFRRGDDYYIVMDYIAGIALDQLMDRGPISPEIAFAITDGLCDVISYLHHQRPPIIHADMKPSNVILANNGQVVLLDFGLARPRNLAHWDDEPIGSLPYAPPEQRRGEPLDERSDLYALGVLLTELLDSVASRSFVRTALEGATAPYRADRFATIRQFQRALHREYAMRVAPSRRMMCWIPDLWTVWTLLILIVTLSTFLLLFGPTRISAPVPVVPTPTLPTSHFQPDDDTEPKLPGFETAEKSLAGIQEGMLLRAAWLTKGAKAEPELLRRQNFSLVA